MSKIILVVAAHADDEALGCGGTIAKHVAHGDTVYTAFLADGVTSRQEACSNKLAERDLAAKRAQEILGIKGTYMLGFPDNRLDTQPLLDIVKKIETVVEKVKPQIIYTHHYGDLNIDHRLTHQAVMTACRPLPGSSIRAIYTFEVMSSTEWSSPTSEPFLPNYFVDISEYIIKKNDALDAYKVEMRQSPHSRSFENISYLAHHRGHSVGILAAEAFMAIRVVD